jgi:hypothetical protein
MSHSLSASFCWITLITDGGGSITVSEEVAAVSIPAAAVTPSHNSNVSEIGSPGPAGIDGT